MTTRNDLIDVLLSKVPHAVDRRSELPRHSSKHFARRLVRAAAEEGQSAIQGIVVHQSAGTGTSDGINKYHIGPNHVSATGAPRALYFAIIDSDGVLHIVNDLEDITWSQGGRTNPVPGTRANHNFLALCVLGDFTGVSYKGASRGPSQAQLSTLERTTDALAFILGLDSAQTYGHYHFGKENCPGKRLQRWVEDRRARGVKVPKTDREWQQRLVDLGYDLGAYGPNQDGVDGSWGAKSRIALVEFQKSSRAHDTGWRDVMTAVELAKAHRVWTDSGRPTDQCH